MDPGEDPQRLRRRHRLAELLRELVRLAGVGVGLVPAPGVEGLPGRHGEEEGSEPADPAARARATAARITRGRPRTTEPGVRRREPRRPEGPGRGARTEELDAAPQVRLGLLVAAGEPQCETEDGGRLEVRLAAVPRGESPRLPRRLEGELRAADAHQCVDGVRAGGDRGARVELSSGSTAASSASAAASARPPTSRSRPGAVVPGREARIAAASQCLGRQVPGRLDATRLPGRLRRLRQAPGCGSASGLRRAARSSAAAAAA